jgi:hypothetical protein
VLLREPGNEQARLGLAAAVERRFAPARPAAQTEDHGAEMEIPSEAGILGAPPAAEAAAGVEPLESGAMPEGELPGWPEVGGQRGSGAAAGAMGSADVTLDDEPELRLPRSDEEEMPAARAAIRRRIGILKTYLDGLRAARSAEGR